MIERVRRRFDDEFGGSAPHVGFAPGRLNLIGAHLDYSGGDVMPLAVHLGVYAAARLRDDQRLRLRSVDREQVLDVDFDEIGERARDDFGWAAYPLGVVREFAARTGETRGLEIVFGGDLPMASGLSSSAAIEVVTAFVLASLHGVELGPHELAMMSYRAENDYVGLRCGIMDQFASAFGRDGHAMLLHCHDVRVEHVPLDPEAFDVLVCDTRKPRNLASTEFNVRVQQCAHAFEVLRRVVGPRACLAHYTRADLEAAGGALDAVSTRRVRHVVTEMERVASAVASLRRGDVAGFGRCVSASHESTRVDYEVSCDELDFVTATAIGQPGVFGARLTGAGFGGCAFALVDPARTEAVRATIRSGYVGRFGVEPGFHVLRPGGGPRRLT